MFYYTAKFAWPLIDPANLLVVVAAIGLILSFGRGNRIGRVVLGGAVCLLALASFSPIASLALASLESRFPPWRDTGRPIDGIVVLGGGIDGPLYAEHRGSGMTGASVRIIEAARLALRFRSARIVVSSGDPMGEAGANGEADAALDLFSAFGVDASRISIESRSRNTYENALYSKQVAQPRPGELWVVLTSAVHMPRAIGCFRAVDFGVEAYPVDYRTPPGAVQFAFNLRAAQNLLTLGIVLHEALGLLAYRLTDRTAELLPGP